MICDCPPERAGGQVRLLGLSIRPARGAAHAKQGKRRQSCSGVI
jgi:hypothetical protein